MKRDRELEEGRSEKWRRRSTSVKHV